MCSTQARRPWVCRVFHAPWHTQILADQLTLFQPGGTDYAHLIKYYWHNRIFRPSDGPFTHVQLKPIEI